MGRTHDPHSPLEPRSKRVRRLSSEEDALDKAELAYYTQSPSSLSSHTSSWHSDIDHGGLVAPYAASASAAAAAAAAASSTFLHPHTPPHHTSQHTLGTRSSTLSLSSGSATCLKSVVSHTRNKEKFYQRQENCIIPKVSALNLLQINLKVNLTYC